MIPRIACALLLSLFAGAPQAPVKIALQIEGPARVGMPIWVAADLKQNWVARYPFGEDLRYFGSNQLELRRNGQPVPALPGRPPSESIGGGDTVSSIAPPTSPTNRLPVHLGFAIDAPGRYAVRWTLNRASGRWMPGASPQNAVILAQSDWLEFDVLPSAYIDRENWLRGLLAAPPTDHPGRYIGDYLPSLLAAVPDPRVLDVIVDGTYSMTSLISSCSLASMRSLPSERVVPLVIDRLQRRGPNAQLAYFISWNVVLFQDRRDDIIRAAIRALQSSDDGIVEGGLEVLNFAPHFDWPTDPPVLREAETALLHTAAVLVRRNAVQQALAVALGGVRGDVATARSLLQQIVDRRVPASEQASIAIKWLDGTGGLTPLTADSELHTALLKLLSRDGTARRAAAQTLLELAANQPDRSNVGPELVDRIIRRRSQVNNDDAWRDAALILARLHSPYTTVLTLYLERDGAADALIDTGEPAVTTLVDILKVGGPARRRIAAQTLGAIGGDHAREGLITARATESDPAVKNAIDYALSHLGQRPPRADIR